MFYDFVVSKVKKFGVKVAIYAMKFRTIFDSIFETICLVDVSTTRLSVRSSFCSTIEILLNADLAKVLEASQRVNFQLGILAGG